MPTIEYSARHAAKIVAVAVSFLLLSACKGQPTAPAPDSAASSVTTQSTTPQAPDSPKVDDVLTAAIQPNPAFAVLTDMTFTSKVDAITLTSLTINRGNCKSPNPSGVYIEKATPLKFGEQVTFTATCKPIEAEISTDHGDFVFKFE